MQDETDDRLRFVFADGSEGAACGLSDNLLRAIGPVAHAPGRPLSLRFTLGDTQFEVRGKSLGSKRRADGCFDLRIRLVDLRREHRASLTERLTD